MNHQCFIFHITLSIIAFSCSSMNNRKMASTYNDPITYNVKEGEPIGKNFFKVFGVGATTVSSSEEKFNIFDQKGVTLSYYSKSSSNTPIGVLSIKGIRYDLIYIKMDNFKNITNIERVKEGGNLPQVAISMVMELTGIRELAKALNINPENNQENHRELIKALYNPTDNLDNSLPTYDVEGNDLIGKNFFEVFGDKPTTVTPSEERFKILNQDGIILFYFRGYYSSTPYATLRMKWINYDLVYISMDKLNNITNISGIKMTGNPLQVAISSIREFKGIEELAKALNINPESNQENIDALGKILNSKRENSVLATKTFEKSFVEDSDNGLRVPKYYYAIKKYDKGSNIEALKAYGAKSSTILIIYDKKNKVGYMAHFDEGIDIEGTMTEISSPFKKSSGELYSNDNELKGNNSIEVTLIGDLSSRLQIALIISYLNKNLPSFSLNQDISIEGIENTWLNLETGEVNTFRINPYLKSHYPLLFDMLIRTFWTNTLRKVKGSD